MVIKKTTKQITLLTLSLWGLLSLAGGAAVDGKDILRVMNRYQNELGAQVQSDNPVKIPTGKYYVIEFQLRKGLSYMITSIGDSNAQEVNVYIADPDTNEIYFQDKTKGRVAELMTGPIKTSREVVTAVEIPKQTKGKTAECMTMVGIVESEVGSTI